MSSAHKSPPQPQEITTKKKFGKNLNKLTKPPPVASTISAKSNASSRNGLLLLSTKRPSSTSAAASAGGILASKSVSVSTAKPLPSLGLQNKSSTSTHDALLGAVVGASRAESQEPDAWGVAEKQKNNELDWNSDHGDATPNPDVQPVSDRSDRPESELPSTTWDEYGGRNVNSTGSTGLYNPTGESDEDRHATLRDRAEKKRAEEELRQMEQRERSAQKLRELEQKMVNEGAKDQQVKPRTLYDPNKPNMISYSASAGGNDAPPSPEAARLQNGNNGIYSSEAVDSYSRQPVIQLSSYDDKDRGERGATAAPRMLYDPKSGSMVAVPTRDESSAATKGKNKERGKKSKNPKELKLDPRQDEEAAKVARKGKRVEKKSGPTELSSPAKIEPKKGKVVNERKLPRTCGVLYTRDMKGNFISVDGCDGDLGYGSHSVPGGRMKNPDSYTKYLKEQKRTQEDAEAYKDDHLDASFEADADDEVMLHTGFNAPEPREVKFDWVKPSDKLELITGADESPTLQATAKAWAPSQAALAAAVARFGAGGDRDMASEDEDDGPVS